MFGVLIDFLLYILELFGTKEENWVQTKTQAKTQATGELFNPGQVTPAKPVIQPGAVSSAAV